MNEALDVHPAFVGRQGKAGQVLRRDAGLLGHMSKFVLNVDRLQGDGGQGGGDRGAGDGEFRTHFLDVRGIRRGLFAELVDGLLGDLAGCGELGIVQVQGGGNGAGYKGRVHLTPPLRGPLISIPADLYNPRIPALLKTPGA